MRQLNKVLSAYIDCALWSSSDDAGEPLNDIFGHADFSQELKAQFRADCSRFLEAIECIDSSAWDDSQLGHDFWLTRNGHGAGFWDRGFPNGDALSEIARGFGGFDLYVGDEGLIYGSGSC